MEHVAGVAGAALVRRPFCVAEAGKAEAGVEPIAAELPRRDEHRDDRGHHRARDESGRSGEPRRRHRRVGGDDEGTETGRRVEGTVPEHRRPHRPGAEPGPAEQHAEHHAGEDHEQHPGEIGEPEVVAEQDQRCVPEAPERAGDEQRRPDAEGPKCGQQPAAPSDLLAECQRCVDDRTDGDHHELHGDEQHDRRGRRAGREHRVELLGEPREADEIETGEVEQPDHDQPRRDEQRQHDDRGRRHAERAADRAERPHAEVAQDASCTSPPALSPFHEQCGDRGDRRGEHHGGGDHRQQRVGHAEPAHPERRGDGPGEPA